MDPDGGRDAPYLDIGYAVAAVAALCAGLALWWADPGVYAFLFGPVPAPWVLVPGLLAGGLALGAIHKRRGEAVRPSGSGPIAVALGIGLAWSILPIAIDLLLPFPPDINVALPEALVFYPVIAVLAEALFHLVPLGLLVALSGARRTQSALPLLAAIEPALQTVLGGGPVLQQGLSTLHIYGFNLVQLHLFWRFGFGAMIAMRLGFYLGWHMIWGYLRLAHALP